MLKKIFLNPLYFASSPHGRRKKNTTYLAKNWALEPATVQKAPGRTYSHRGGTRPGICGGAAALKIGGRPLGLGLLWCGGVGAGAAAVGVVVWVLVWGAVVVWV